MPFYVDAFGNPSASGPYIVANGGGGGGAGATSGMVGNTAFQTVSPLADPKFYDLFQQARGAVPTSMPSLDSIIQEGMSSPLLSAILGPALERLRQPQADQRMQLTDAARAAGGLRGSPYQNAYVDLQNVQGQQTNDLIGQVISQMLNPIISGRLNEQRNMFMPAQAYTDILQASRPQIVTGNVGGSSASAYVDDPSNDGPNSFLNRPFSDPYAELGIPRPTPYSGSSYTPPPPEPTTPYNPFSNLGIGGSYGGSGSQITYNPVSGFYESAPSANAMQGRDQWGYTPQDWANDPFYS